MRLTLATTARRATTVLWLGLIAVLIGLVPVTRLTTTDVIHGGSMAPTIPFGSLVIVEGVAPNAVAVGDVVTVRAENGVVITHRVTRTIQLPGGHYLEVKGDANPTPDPVLVPAGAVIGRVAVHIPIVGYLAGMLGTSVGLVSLLALVAAGLLTILLAEGLEDELAERERTRGAASPEGSPRGAHA